MRRSLFLGLALTLLLNVSLIPMGFTESAEDVYQKATADYTGGHIIEALDGFRHVTDLDPSFGDAYYNQGAIYFNLRRYSEALETFNKVLQLDPNDQAARYDLARTYEQLGRKQEAIAAFDMIGPASSRYASAQENLKRLEASESAVSPSQQTAVAVASPAQPNTTPTSPLTVTAQPKPAAPLEKAVVTEFASGFAGPTGVAVDKKGTVYVANFSKNNIYKIKPNGEKIIFASGQGINGPVGLTLDHKTGTLYIANHLDNTISKITPDGKVSVIASGLSHPYNLVLDEAHHTLYVSQEDNNSIAQIQLR